MSRFLSPRSGVRSPLWIEGSAYAERLLADGQVPWLDSAAFVAWHLKTQSLLKSDVVALPVAPIVRAWLDRDTTLRQEMSAKPRNSYPLKTLLAHEPLQRYLHELLLGLRSIYAQVPLALVLPSPRAWLVEAYRGAHSGEIHVDEDDVDAASLYAANFVRTFGDIEADVLLLAEDSDTQPANSNELAWYGAVFNVASHLRWELGLLCPSPLDRVERHPGLGFCICPPPTDGLGTIVTADFWDGAQPPACPPGGFRYVDIPVDALPERVLSKLLDLRQAG